MEPFYRYLVRAREVDSNSITTLEQALPRLEETLARSGYPDSNSVSKQFYDSKGPTVPQGVTGIYFFDSQRGGLVRRPGHLTIHTWPETDGFALDLVLAQQDDQAVERITQAFPGDYHIITECGGKLSQQEISQQFGRQALAYLVNPRDRRYLNPERVLSLLEEVSQEAKFKIAEDDQTRAKKKIVRFNNDYLSAGVVLTTSHFITHYLPKEGIVIVDTFTCTEGGIDEGDPKLGRGKFISRTNPQDVCYLVDLKR